MGETPDPFLFTFKLGAQPDPFLFTFKLDAQFVSKVILIGPKRSEMDLSKRSIGYY